MITCKKCNGAIFYRSFPTRGTWTETLISTEKGLEVDSSTTDDLMVSNNSPKTITCADCGTRNPNPDYIK